MDRAERETVGDFTASATRDFLFVELLDDRALNLTLKLTLSRRLCPEMLGCSHFHILKRDFRAVFRFNRLKKQNNKTKYIATKACLVTTLIAAHSFLLTHKQAKTDKPCLAHLYMKCQFNPIIGSLHG